METQYKYVYHSPSYRFPKRAYKAQISINGMQYSERHETPQLAAKAIDKILIRHNKPPINILKPKT